MIRLYIKDFVENFSDSFRLEFDHFNYLINVMRLSIDDEILVFNSKVGEYRAKISQINKKSCDVKLIKIVRKPYQEKELVLAFALIKPKRLEMLIDMATQLGVTVFQPLITDNVTLHKVNEEKLYSWVVESSEQSERMHIPQINAVIRLNDFLQNIQDQSFIYANERENNVDIKSVININKINILIVGPEGGWSDKEIQSFSNFNNGASITLGTNILRAETAVACLLSQYKLLQ